MSGRLKIIMEGDSKELEDIMRNVFAKRQAVEAEVRQTDLTIEQQAKITETLRILADMYNKRAKSQHTEQEAMFEELRIQLSEWDTRIKLTDMKAKLTIRNSLLALRGTVDALNFLSALTGEHVETHFLSMISMGLSAALQIKLQAAIYAATPGTQPLALMILSLLPALTGMMLWQRAEMLKWTTKIHEQNQQDWEHLLGGI